MLLDTQVESNVTACVGQVIRFWDEYVFLKEIIDKNTYGKLKSIALKRLSPLPTWAWENWLHDEKRSGGMTLDLHIHDTDCARWLLGEPKEVCSHAQKGAKGEIEHIFTQFYYTDKIVSVEGCWDFPKDFPFEMSYLARFEQATAAFSSLKNPSVTVYKAEGGVLSPEIKTQFSDNNDIGGNLSSLGGYFGELKYWLECIRENKAPEIAPLSEGIKSFELVMKEIESCK